MTVPPGEGARGNTSASTPYTGQDRRVLRNACAGMGTSTYQPAAEDIEAADRLIAAGLIEVEPGFATLRATAAGRNAYADLIDARL